MPNLVNPQQANDPLIRVKATAVPLSKGEKKSVRNQVGQVIVICGVLPTLIVSLLFYVAPDLFSIWYIKINSIYDNIEVFIGGFASIGVDIGFGVSINSIQGDQTLIVVAAINVLGIIIGLIGAGTRSKGRAIGGGLMLIISCIVILVVIADSIGVFEGMEAAINLMGNKNLFYGSYSDMSGTASWGIGVGTIMPLISGIIIMGGGFLLEKESYSTLKAFSNLVFSSLEDKKKWVETQYRSGKSFREIGEELGESMITVRHYLDSDLEKYKSGPV